MMYHDWEPGPNKDWDAFDKAKFAMDCVFACGLFILNIIFAWLIST